MHAPSQSDERQQGRVFIDACSGALAGCLSRFLVGPLDVIKIRFQVQLEPIGEAKDLRSIRYTPKYTSFKQALWTVFKEEGVKGLWRGTVPGLLLTIPYTAVQFVAHHQCKDAAKRWGLLDANGFAPFVSFTSGALAGAAATIASYPFDLLRTTLAAQGEPKVHRGMWDACRAIINLRGPLGLYSGLGVTLVEIMPYAALQFSLYDATTAAWQRAEVALHGKQAATQTSHQYHQVRHLVCGLAAGLFAKLVTAPLDVAKKRYQVAGLQRSLSYGARVDASLAGRSLVQCLRDIYVSEGIRGLWKGSVPSLIKAAPAAAITFWAYEGLSQVLVEMVQAHEEGHTQSKRLPVQPLVLEQEPADKIPARGDL